MSYVTSVVIVVGYATKEFEEAVTAENDFGRGELVTAFRALDMAGAGGTKYPGTDVFAAGLNYADAEALRAWLDALPWYGFGVVTISTEGAYEQIRIYQGKRPPTVIDVPEPEENSGWHSEEAHRAG